MSFKPDTKSARKKKRLVPSKRTSGERTGDDPEIANVPADKEVPSETDPKIDIKLSLTASPEETERVDTDNIQTEVPAENDSEIENKSSPTSSLEKTDEIVDIDHIKTKDPDETNPEIDKKSFPTANDEKVT